MLTRLLVGMLVLFSLAACSGLPEQAVRKAKYVPTQLKDYQRALIDQRNQFEMLKKDSQWAFLKPYAEREDWNAYSAKAEVTLNKAQALYQNQVLPILEQDRPGDVHALRTWIDEIEKLAQQSVGEAAHHARRSKFLLHVRDNAPKLRDDALTLVEEIAARLDVVSNTGSQLARKYPAKTLNIDERTATATAINASARASLVSLQREFDGIAAQQADYALLGQAGEEIKTSSEKMRAYEEEFLGKMNELDTSYVKVLADQKIDYFVVVGRSSWCNGDSCYGENLYQYPAVKVDEAIYDHIDKSIIESLATLRYGWGGRDFKVIAPKVWNALGIKYSAQWKRGDQEADYWVENSYAVAQHRYLVITDDKEKKTAWQPVTEDYFWLHQENLGLAIETKPYGLYVEDMLKDAEPVGMATIAEPVMVNGVATGSNQYGEWRNENGHSFWHYYGMYRLFGDLIGGSRYSYDDWQAYRQRRKKEPFYGRDYEYGTYGSTTYGNSRYRHSDYARRNPTTVAEAGSERGQRRSTASVRGAGAATRNRGPGGAGK